MSSKTGFSPNFFSPQSIAFIGASERGLYPAGIMQNLIEKGYTGEVFPVNPKRESVFGLPCYPSVKSLPRRPDLALLTVPRNAVLPVLKECIECSVPAALIISAGFSESDQTGVSLQAEMTQLVHDQPIRVIGPNCAGLANLTDHLIATRLSGELISGPVSFASQSGALMMSLQGVFSDRNIGMAKIVSLGNQVDITLAEMLNELVDDPETKVITAFMEGLGHGEQLIHAFRKALIAGKPIILLKSGRTQRGMAAAATHTAALAGEDRVFQAICDQFGVILVDDIEPMMDTAQLAAHFATAPRNIGFISQSGGLGSLTADWIDKCHLSASPLPPALINALHQLGTIPEYAKLMNPADVRGASVSENAAGRTLQAFIESPEYDAVVMLFARSFINDAALATAQSIARTAGTSTKPVMIVWSGQKTPIMSQEDTGARNILREAKIPVFSESSSFTKALMRLNRYWVYRELFLNGFWIRGNNA